MNTLFDIIIKTPRKSREVAVALNTIQSTHEDDPSDHYEYGYGSDDAGNLAEAIGTGDMVVGREGSKLDAAKSGDLYVIPWYV